MPVRQPKLPKNNIHHETEHVAKTIPFKNRFPDVQVSPLGIYAYVDTETNRVVYIGKDSHINNYSRKWHHENNDKQAFDSYLKITQKKYHWELVAIVANKDWLEDIEQSLIRQFRAIGQCEWNVQDILGRN